jgi:hypothetical protein
MSNYLTVRDAAVEQIRAGLLPLYPKMTVEAHPGGIDQPGKVF